MDYVKIRLEGRSHLMMDALDPEGKKAGGADPRSAHEQARAKLWRSITDDESVVIPGVALWKTIKGGGRFVKRAGGKGAMWSSKSTSELPGVLEWLVDEAILESVDGWTPHVGSVRTQKGERLAVCRPVFTDWTIEFVVGVDTDLLPMDTFREIVDNAGRRIGLGVMRPERGYFNGQFLVVKWEVLKNYKTKRAVTRKKTRKTAVAVA